MSVLFFVGLVLLASVVPARAQPDAADESPASQNTPRLLLLQYGAGSFPADFATRAKNGGRVPFAWLFYALQIGGRTFLIDTGFSKKEQRARFQVKDFKAPVSLLASAGIRPAQVRKILLTHGHFDHAGETARFPRARLYYRKPARGVLLSRHGPAGMRSVLDRARLEGRLVELAARPGSTQTVYRQDGLQVQLRFTGGHSPGHQAVEIEYHQRRFIITGDECYLLSECKPGRGLPDRAAFSPAANRAFMAYLKQAVARGAVLLTLHDPGLPGRFQRLGPGVFQVF